MNTVEMNQPQSFKGAFVKPENVKLTKGVLKALSNDGTNDIWMVPIKESNGLSKKMLIVFGNNDCSIFNYLKELFPPIKFSFPLVKNIKITKPKFVYESLYSTTAERIIDLLQKRFPPVQIQKVNSQKELDAFVRNKANLDDNKLSSISIADTLVF